MMRKASLLVFLVLLGILISTQSSSAQESDTAVVQAILFYSPTCPHCHDVIENHLPLIKDKYGDQLQLIGIDTSHQSGSKLYEDTVITFAIPQDRLGVPTLVIGNVVLVGGQEIPDRLPTLIEDGLAEGGIGWPAIPGLEEAVPNLPPAAGSQGINSPSTEVKEPGDVVITEALPDNSESPPKDQVGFTIGWIVMAAMIAALIYSAIRLLGIPRGSLSDPDVVGRFQGWFMPLLAFAGLGIASYLSYVEISRVAAVCGPVGECNIVQSSQYAQVLGIPVAVLGFLFYLAILGLWVLLRLVKTQWIRWIPLLLLIFSFAGMLFSIYLTALELFVIKAVCAWCLGSAVVTTLLYLITVKRVTKQDDKSLKTHNVATHTG